MDLDRYRWQGSKDLLCTYDLTNWWHQIQLFSIINRNGVITFCRIEYSTHLESHLATAIVGRFCWRHLSLLVLSLFLLVTTKGKSYIPSLGTIFLQKVSLKE